MEKRVIPLWVATYIHNIFDSVIAHTREMIMAAHFYQNLMFVLYEQLEVGLVRERLPHRVTVVPSTCVDMLNDDKLASFFSMFELFCKPEHLLYTVAATVDARPLTIVIDCVDREN